MKKISLLLVLSLILSCMSGLVLTGYAEDNYIYICLIKIF